MVAIYIGFKGDHVGGGSSVYQALIQHMVHPLQLPFPETAASSSTYYGQPKKSVQFSDCSQRFQPTSFNDVAVRDCLHCHICRPYRTAQNRLLWRDKTCSASVVMHKWSLPVDFTTLTRPQGAEDRILIGRQNPTQAELEVTSIKGCQKP